MDLLLHSTLFFFFNSFFSFTGISFLGRALPGSLLHPLRGPFLSFAFSILPFYSSSASFPSLFSCNTQPSFKHPVSLPLLLLLSLGLYPLYRGFIRPLWLCFLLSFVNVFLPFPFSSPFFRFSFFCMLSSPVLGYFPFSSSSYLAGLPSSLATSASCSSAPFLQPLLPPPYPPSAVSLK